MSVAAVAHPPRPADHSPRKVPNVAEHSRRTFISRVSVGAAAIGAAAAVAPLVTGSSSANAGVSGPMHDGPFAAWVQDVKTGEVAVMVGSQTILHVDKQLATQLARIAGSAPKH